MRSRVNCRLLGSALRGFPSAKQQSNSYRTACHVWRRLACNARRLGSKCSRRLPISRLLRSLPTPSGPRQRTNGCGNQARHDQPRSGNYPGRTQESEALALVCRRGQTPSRSTEGRSSTQPRGKTSTAEGVGVPSRMAECGLRGSTRPQYHDARLRNQGPALALREFPRKDIDDLQKQDQRGRAGDSA